jgi:hypothetical protein
MEREFNRDFKYSNSDADQGKVEKEEKAISQIHTCN